MAAIRAEWFAQLAETIEGAQQLAWELGAREGASGTARELYRRLEAARLELDAMRCAGAGSSDELEPDWLQRLGWSSSLIDPGG